MLTLQEIAQAIREHASEYQQIKNYPFGDYPNRVCIIGMLCDVFLPNVAQEIREDGYLDTWARTGVAISALDGFGLPMFQDICYAPGRRMELNKFLFRSNDGQANAYGISDAVPEGASLSFLQIADLLEKVELC